MKRSSYPIYFTGILLLTIAMLTSGCPQPVELISVPDVVGMTQSVAEDAIEAADLVVGTITEESHDSIPAGEVISQNPAAGESVPPNTPVNFIVSLGAAEGPTAAFMMNHSSGDAPLIVQFEDISTAGTGAITSWSWDFDDLDRGTTNTSTFQNPSHVFNTEGAYSVTLNVTTAYGSDSVSHEITVFPGQGEIINQNVRVVDDIPTLSLDMESGPNYTFNYTGNGVPPVEPGDILVGTEGEGYLRRVSAVKSWHTKADGTKSVAITTEFCSLNEVVEKGTLVLDKPIQFTTDDLTKAGMVVTKSGAFVSLDGFSLSGSFGADLYGQIGFLPSLDVEFGLDWWKLDYLKMAAHGTLDLDLGIVVSFEGELSYSQERSIFREQPPTSRIVANIGPIPVVIVTQFDTVAGISLGAAGSVSVDQGFYSSTSVGFGAEYDSGTWNPITNANISAMPYGPVWTTELEAGVVLYLKPEIRTRLYGVTGPSMAVVPYLDFHVEPIACPLTAKLRAGINTELAFDVINLDIIDVDFAVGFNHTLEGPNSLLYEGIDERPNLAVDTTSVSLDPDSPSAVVVVSNAGEGTLCWTATANDPAIDVSPSVFTGNSEVVSISTSDFSESYTAHVTFTSDNDTEDKEVVVVSITESDPYDDPYEETIMLPTSDLFEYDPVYLEFPHGVPLEMVWIPPGSFMMGSPEDEQGRFDREGPQHEVIIAKGFWMGKYPVTQAQWRAITGSNPNWPAWSENHQPVHNITWNDIRETDGFLDKLNALSLDFNFRLPSEAEWEYAARAGTQTRFYWGDDPDYTDIDNYAWYGGNNDPHGPKPVGQKFPNNFGLYDMLGSPLEYCEDDFHPNYEGAPSNGSAWVDEPRSRFRVQRGGCYSNHNTRYIRSADRRSITPDFTGGNTACRGFRIVRTP